MIELRNATVMANAQNSNVVDINGNLICGIYTMQGMSSTTMTFMTSPRRTGIPAPISDGAGGYYSRTFVAGDYVPLDPSLFSGCNFLTIILGSQEGTECDLLITTRE